MANLKGCYSHESDHWKTPNKMYKYFLNKGYFDPCPYESYYDGLLIEWGERNFVNPPYSQIKEWVEKAITEHRKGRSVIMLIPARTDTRYFEKLYQYGAVFIFITGRLRFSEKNSAPFPSVLVCLQGRGPSHMLLYKSIKGDVDLWQYM